MQEVFEKIIEKLESKIFSAELYGEEWNGQTADNLLCLGDVRDTIEQAVAEYNNGWNDIVEKGLPPVGKPLIVTIKDNLQGTANELRYPVYYEKDSMKGGYHWSWRYGDFAYELLPNVSEVIAWKPLPEPYQPKGE